MLPAILGCSTDPASPDAGPDDAAVSASASDPEYDALFGLEHVPSLHVALSEAEWNALLHDYDQNNRTEVYRRARLVVGDDPETAQVFEDVGFRLRGNVFTRERPEEDGHGDGVHHADNRFRRVHFKIKLDERFDEDESVYGPPAVDHPERPDHAGRALVPGVETLNLKFNNDDPTYLREVLAYSLFHRFGVEAPRAAFVRLTIQVADEPPRSMGVFSLIESVDADWVRRRFPSSAGGGGDFVFKCLWQGEGPADLSVRDTQAGPRRGRIGIEDTDPATPEAWPAFTPYRPAYDLKTNRSRFDEAETALNDLIAQLAEDADENALRSAIDIEALLAAMAVSVFVGNADDYWRLGNNYYLVRRPDDGRWQFVPYDQDRTFGVTSVGDDPATSPFVGWGDSGRVDPVLMERVLSVPALRARYLSAVQDLVAEGGIFREDVIRAEAERLQALIAPYAADPDAEDPFPYDPDLDALLEFVRTRIATAKAELAAEG